MKHNRSKFEIVKRLTLSLGLALFFFGMTACHSQFIPNTTVEDTTSNREIIDFCESYRRALEQRDVGALLAMASPRYYENSGTPEGEDDYDIAGLRTVLTETLPRVHTVRYEFRYRRVMVESDNVLVDYTYSGSFRVETEDGHRWFRRVADNRLELERVGGQYRVVAGM
jgi:hypothetical protein